MTQELGQSIPPETSHAVSVSLPSWKANVGYEEGEDWVLSKMKTGYPRIQRFAEEIVDHYGLPGDRALLFPSRNVARRCKDFFHAQDPSLPPQQIRVIEIAPPHSLRKSEDEGSLKSDIWAVLFPRDAFSIAKTYWQHTGDGVSSRRAEFCHHRYHEWSQKPHSGGEETQSNKSRLSKGPRRYQNRPSIDDGNHVNGSTRSMNGQSSASLTEGAESQEYFQFIEERFGRNLNPAFAASAKLAIRRRISGSLTANVDLGDAAKIEGNPEGTRKVKDFSEDDKWGPGCLFYGNGSLEDLDDLELRLNQGERFLALFCEFPGNPLLKCPDLQRIRSLADKFDFAVVVDETVGNFMNVHVLPYADFVVSSLTKVFSGDSNVMGGSLVLNPQSRYYHLMRKTLVNEYEDNYWAEDALFMERNSRDFVSRIERINVNAEAVCKVLQAHPRVKAVYYPKHSSTRPFYERCRNPNGGYGGLLSATFYSTAEAVTFFDRIEIAKGPSLGTNFTLCSPYTLLAHYGELDWAAQFGVEADLVRVSVGLEDTHELAHKFEHALAVVEAISRS
ncbi:MAG: hypothetical protein M4579_005473 [Chaenotheca gracillima]|nr:MAG: hypothetical protein M4579_005473 [Chaenotheca gracillima]